MMTIQEIRSQRAAVGIPAITLAGKAKINRSKLSGFERGHFQPTEVELKRLAAALGELIAARAAIQQTAASVGWPGAGF